ncbi:Peptide chain release factor c12orf65 [Globisporangium polare]
MLQRVVRRCGARLHVPEPQWTASAPPCLHATPAAPVQARELWRATGSSALPHVRWFSAPPVKKQPIVLREEDLEESFVKGSGKGGQKINKVRNCVLLKHTPTGLHVRCQKTRSLDDNRRVARKLLVQKLDDQLNGELSARNVKFSKLRKRKASKKAKSSKKYSGHAAMAAADASDEDEGEEEESDDEQEDSDGDEHEDDDVDEVDVEEHKFKAKKKSD